MVSVMTSPTLPLPDPDPPDPTRRGRAWLSPTLTAACALGFLGLGIVAVVFVGRGASPFITFQSSRYSNYEQVISWPWFWLGAALGAVCVVGLVCLARSGPAAGGAVAALAVGLLVAGSLAIDARADRLRHDAVDAPVAYLHGLTVAPPGTATEVFDPYLGAKQVWSEAPGTDLTARCETLAAALTPTLQAAPAVTWTRRSGDDQALACAIEGLSPAGDTVRATVNGTRPVQVQVVAFDPAVPWSEAHR